MKKRQIEFKPGVITLFDREIDNEFGGSLLLKNQETPLSEDKEAKEIGKEYLDLIDFPLLFNFLWLKLKLIVEKLFYSDDAVVNKGIPAFSFKLPSKSLAIIFLLVSFLSLSSILLPLAIAKINAINQQGKAEEIAMVNKKLAEERAAQLKLYEIDPAKEQAATKDFKLFIPKIGLDSDISPSVNLDNEEDYKRELLTTGIAHAKGSYFPGQKGSVFLFAHSTDTIFNIARFNAKFFSLGELENGDEIRITYRGKDYKYAVSGKQIIEPDQVDLIRNSGNALILMTCTPPGTDWQRLVIFAE